MRWEVRINIFINENYLRDSHNLNRGKYKSDLLLF